MSDVNIVGGTPSTPGFPANTCAMIAAAAYPPGTPVYVSGASTVTQGADTSAAAAQIMGVLPRASVLGEYGPVQYGGTLTLTEAEWNAVISDATPAGLTSGKTYWVGAAGKITKVAPVSGGSFDGIVGLALSPQTMLILPCGLAPHSN